MSTSNIVALIEQLQLLQRQRDEASMLGNGEGVSYVEADKDGQWIYLVAIETNRTNEFVHLLHEHGWDDAYDVLKLDE